MQVRMRFPSCWDGVDVDSEDHKSHVRYPSRVDSGECPAGYPVRVPSLMYEMTWDVEAFAGERGMGMQPFV